MGTRSSRPGADALDVVRGRFLVLGAVLLSLMGLIGSPATAGGTDALAPNLVVQRAEDLALSVENGRRLLRFTTQTSNVGPGALELRSKMWDCDGDGSLANDRTAVQRVYRDVDGDGVFRRAIDTSVTKQVVGCFFFHRAHAHWHFRNFARYALRPLGGGPVIAVHAKVGFCLLDTNRLSPAVPGSPQSAYYGACRASSTQGLSVGWADVYQASLAGQWIDVTGVASGRYCLVTVVDPRNVLAELRDTDNRDQQAIRLRSQTVAPLSTGC